MSSIVRVGLIDKVTCEQSLGGRKGISCADTWGKGDPGEGPDSVNALMWEPSWHDQEIARRPVHLKQSEQGSEKQEIRSKGHWEATVGT